VRKGAVAGAEGDRILAKPGSHGHKSMGHPVQTTRFRANPGYLPMGSVGQLLARLSRHGHEPGSCLLGPAVSIRARALGLPLLREIC
jgi:hypothetical protein